MYRLGEAPPEQRLSVLRVGETVCGLDLSGAIVCDDPGWVVPEHADGLVTLDVGYDAICGVTADGALECVSHGSGDERWADVAAIGPVVDVCVGDGYGCAILGDRVACWDPGSAAVSERVGEFVGVACGREQYVVLDSSGSVSWSASDADLGPAAPDESFVSVSSRDFSCGVTTSGAIACWGLELEQEPFDVPAGDDYVLSAAGTGQVCGLHATGRITCAEVPSVVE